MLSDCTGSSPIWSATVLSDPRADNHEALYASGLDDLPAGAAIRGGQQHRHGRGIHRPDEGRAPAAALLHYHSELLVPMLKDGDLKLTESSAILKYLADKIGSPTYRPIP